MINSPRTNVVFNNMALPQRVRLKISPIGEAHVDLAEVASVTLREGADILVVLRGGEWWFDVLDTPENREALASVLVGVCAHEWIIYMIPVVTPTGTYEKPGRRACKKCGVDETPVPSQTITTT